jgi:hypothetical protein
LARAEAISIRPLGVGKVRSANWMCGSAETGTLPLAASAAKSSTRPEPRRTVAITSASDS